MTITIETTIHFQPRGRGAAKRIGEGTAPSPVVYGRVPRIARLMALAIRFEGLIHDGFVADQAELARLGHVSRARITQIMNLLFLAPEIQEELLFLPLIERGKDVVLLRDLLPIAATAEWRKQRRMWKELLGKIAV